MEALKHVFHWLCPKYGSDGSAVGCGSQRKRCMFIFIGASPIGDRHPREEILPMRKRRIKCSSLQLREPRLCVKIKSRSFSVARESTGVHASLDFSVHWGAHERRTGEAHEREKWVQPGEKREAHVESTQAVITLCCWGPGGLCLKRTKGTMWPSWRSTHHWTCLWLFNFFWTPSDTIVTGCHRPPGL